MAFLLKEALKCLCGENRWSYAVFWKIDCRNPTLLVWEECHYEPARYFSLPCISGIGSTETLPKEWEGLVNSPESQLSLLACPPEDRVCALINKMMMNNQVRVVGEGMVGQAAYTGTHMWIHRENHMGDGQPSEVLAEVNHQFSAGMKTIAVIPVLPHGVVQLASMLAIMESMGFVNHAKSLFSQLGGVPAALLSNNYVEREPDQKNGVPISLGIPVSADQAISKMAKFAPAPFISDSCNQQIPTSQATRVLSQSSNSLIAEIQDNMQANASILQTPSLAPTMTESLTDLFQASALPVKPNLPVRGQQEPGSMGSQVMIFNLDQRLYQQCSLYDSGSRFDHQPLVGQADVSCTGLTFMEKQSLSDDGLQEPVNNSLPAPISTIAQQRTNEATVCNSLTDSGIASLLGGSELHNAGSGFHTPTSVPCSHSIPCRLADCNSLCLPPDVNGLPFANVANTRVVSLSNHSNHSNRTDILPLASHQCHVSIDHKHTQTQFAAGKLGIEKDSLQAFSIPSAHQDEHISWGGSIPNILHDGMISSQKYERGIPPQPVVCEDVYPQPPSGEDLFDILGLHFKNKQLHGSSNGFLMDRGDANAQIFGMNVSTCMTQLDAGPDSMNDGISDSGVYSKSGDDNLLDAVVSKVHSSSKKNLDDNVSCRTTLTKGSSSSVRMDSSMCSQVIVSDQMNIDMYGLSQHPLKAEKAGSSSFNSGCSKDNAAASQINPMYRTQINLWVEDDLSMNQDNSISTAHSKRPREIGKPNRKRLRPGESLRPRPKDRQMIQDRVKELREIVPNGAKCSIDVLLERTIKHMLFLQSVTKHADKLKQTGESKIISKDGGQLLNNNFEGGATWAYEVGSQSMICPIIVEDLNPPRQMLVEMLCEEQGFFLEIADMIRRLGLTILKGLMEARNDKIWACFTVEANRDVTRMEIFLSLVHLLEQAVKNSSPTLKCIDSGNMILPNTVHQASIPATGWCNSLL